MTETIDQVLACLAAPHAGAFRVERAFEAGVTASAVARRLAKGSLYRRHARTYVVGHPGDVPDTEVWAALLAAGPSAVLTCESAAYEWRVSRWTSPPPPIVVMPLRHRPLTRVRLIQSGTLQNEDRAERNGRPVTTVERMLVDFADDLPPERLCWYMRQADYRGVLDLDRLGWTMTRNQNRRGARRMRLALRRYVDGDNGADNRAEVRFVRLLRRAGIHDAVSNKELWFGGEVVRPDVWIEHAGLAVELDEQSHLLAPVAREDRLKEALLRSNGIPLIRIHQSALDAGVRTVLDYLSSSAVRRTISPHIDITARRT